VELYVNSLSHVCLRQLAAVAVNRFEMANLYRGYFFFVAILSTLAAFLMHFPHLRLEFDNDFLHVTTSQIFTF
jgi:hypothetical protein